MNVNHLHTLFNPQQVAIIGASSTPGKIGYSITQNMLKAGFRGEIFPVNPKADEILGLKVTKNIKDLPQGLNLAVICIPREFVVSALKELGEIGTRAVIVITAGFKEVGKEGYYLEEKLIQLARRYNIALLGPNCLGLINTHGLVNASFAAGEPKQGNIAFFSQSGALCVAILDWALGENIGFSKFISLGNKSVLDEADMIAYLGQDDHTKVILGYIENVCDGSKFVEQAQKVSFKKPIILIKSGTTAAGAKAASSHTGAIAGSDQAYNAAFQKSGIIRARDVETLFNLAQAFSSQPLPQGPNLAILTNSGGPGIMAADVCENSSLNMASISSSTIKKLQEFLPSYASLYNPIDIIGDAGARRYIRTLQTIVEDPNIHSILVLLSPTSTAAEEIEEISKGIVDIAQKSSKPVFACFMGKNRVSIGQKILQNGGVPCYAFPEPAIKSIEAMYKHYRWKIHPRPLFLEMPRNKAQAEKVIQKIIELGQKEIVEFQAQEILKAYNLPIPKTILARSSDEACQFATQIGFPVVLKIASPDISHKTDVGGVKVGLKNEKEVRDAFLEITSRAQRLRRGAYILGCLIQEMGPKEAKEIIVGFKRDEQFGPLLMFGLGGIYVEVLKDISFRLAPLTREDAQNMIREVRSYLLLKGFRGKPAINFQILENIILSISQLSMDFPQIFEAELNPVLINNERAMVADVRMTIH
ncbi:acetate--CoA ligase alpha subunit [Desulfovulcanus sp.]